MNRINTPEEGARRLLMLREEEHPEFSVKLRTEDDPYDRLVISDCRIPLLYHRFDPRLKAICDYASEDTDSLSALNVYSFVGRDMSLDELLVRELDIAAYILHSEIESVTAYLNGSSANVIARMKSGTLANLELGATMAEGAINQCQHRLITSRGMASDRVVDTQTVSAMLNLYTSSGEHIEIDPGDRDVFGLDYEDSFKVYCIRAAVLGFPEAQGMNDAEQRAAIALAATHKSASLGRTVSILELTASVGGEK